MQHLQAALGLLVFFGIAWALSENRRATRIRVAIIGDLDRESLKVLGQQLREEVAALPGVSTVELDYTRPYELSIEVPENTLRRHGLTLGQVADAVRRSSLDLPGGSLRSRDGEILLLLRGTGGLHRQNEIRRHESRALVQ